MDPLLAPLGVAAFLAVLALFVLLAQPARRLNQLFAALLLLRAAGTASYGLLRDATGAAEALMYARLTVWYALLTPPLLLAIAGALFFPRSRLRGPAVAAGLALSAVLVALHALAPGALVAAVGDGSRGGFRFDSSPLYDAFSGAIALLEAALVVLAARAARSPRESALSRAQAALLGVAFAVVPVRSGAMLASFLLLDPGRVLPASLALRTAPAILAVALIATAIPSLARGLEGAPRRFALLLLPAAAALGALDAVGAVLGAAFLPGYDTGSVLARAAFAALVALALVRYGLAGASERARARFEALARAGLVAAGALLVAGAALAILGLTTAGLAAASLLGVSVVLLSPAPLGVLAPRLLRRILLPPDDPRDEAERLRLAQGAPDPGAGALLGRYRVVRELGRGASGSAHLAVDLLTGATVVVKRFHAPAGPGALAEARALGAVRHPRVVPLLDVERVGQETFLVLGHVPGGTAREALAREGPLPAARAVGLALDVLEGLDALHGRGIAHGDVKPENVLLDAQGRAVLGDLGSAKPLAADVTLTGPLVGVSLSTVAPELLRGARASPASDLYATGALLHRLLTGRHYVDLDGADAFTARERILLDAPRLPDPRVPPGVEEVLRRALAKRPEDRHAGAREMAAALRAASGLLVDEHAAAHPEDVAGT